MNVGLTESYAVRIIDSRKLATANRGIAIRASVSSGFKGLRRHFRAVAEVAQLAPARVRKPPPIWRAFRFALRRGGKTSKINRTHFAKRDEAFRPPVVSH
jgi:hypothetical protein